MPIDYSKWDKIELSDDSDIEVHPNVDKRSFIKWKQRDIHEKRDQRNREIHTIRIQNEMYTVLNERMDTLISGLPHSSLGNEAERNAFIAAKFNPTDRCSLEDDPDSPTYNEMIEDLFTQIEGDIKKEGNDPKNPDLVLEKLKSHRARIDKVLRDNGPRLDRLLEEKADHISSEDIHDGFNRVIINKQDESASAEPPKSQPTATKTVKSEEKVVTTINTPVASSKAGPSKPLDQLDELEVLQETEAFSHISTDNFLESGRFLERHPYIISEQQKDALLMTAFDAELAGDSKRAYEIVHQSTLIQFADQLSGGSRGSRDARVRAVGMLIGKLIDPNHQTRKIFMEDVKRTFEHIIGRCKTIRAEEEANEGQEGVEQIQLRSMDPNSELVVSIPPEGTAEYAAFEKIPLSMQEALRTGSLDEINKVFGSMEVPAAEAILELFDECGVISIQALLENEDEFNELKGQFETEQPAKQLERLEELDLDDEVVSTADLVD
ncbi:unnamed protein product [Kuraishia capsulata CBS 1993]|uniref:Hsp90 chaperone protein kinase-targeting subunit n=1 Tax=Kuraishia capsulata CBS 1993 TaxID=1382522 RepID=W6MS98_9ASCO|nr:uncharacterized protein KUCA_T00000656001 [Kuraishia capsulata CBS 1993]CDK24690.1 unnamed protein product [Kuraishia capsulata CBS 1993]